MSILATLLADCAASTPKAKTVETVKGKGKVEFADKSPVFGLEGVLERMAKCANVEKAHVILHGKANDGGKTVLDGANGAKCAALFKELHNPTVEG